MRCKLYNHQGTKEPKNRGKQRIIDGTIKQSTKEKQQNSKHMNVYTQMIHGHLIQENESTIQINDKKTHLKGRQCAKQRKLGLWSKTINERRKMKEKIK